MINKNKLKKKSAKDKINEEILKDIDSEIYEL